MAIPGELLFDKLTNTTHKTMSKRKRSKYQDDNKYEDWDDDDGGGSLKLKSKSKKRKSSGGELEIGFNKPMSRKQQNKWKRRNKK